MTAGVSAAANPPVSKGWLLTQRHSANGIQQIYIFPQRLRVENKDLGNCLIADAQSGKVWVFNDTRKIICCVNWDQFQHTFSKMMSVSGESIAKLKWSKAKDQKKIVLAGLATNCYKAYDEKLYFKGGRAGYVSGDSRMIDVEHTMYVASKIRISPKLLKVLSEMQTAPALDGVPLKQSSFFTQHKKLRVFLDTLAAKEIGDDKKFWTVPKYKQMPTVADVANVTDRSFLEDIIGKP